MTAAEKLAEEIVDAILDHPTLRGYMTAQLATLLDAAHAVIIRLTDLDAGAPLDKRDVGVLDALDAAYAALAGSEEGDDA